MKSTDTLRNQVLLAESCGTFSLTDNVYLLELIEKIEQEHTEALANKLPSVEQAKAIIGGFIWICAVNKIDFQAKEGIRLNDIISELQESQLVEANK